MAASTSGGCCSQARRKMACTRTPAAAPPRCTARCSGKRGPYPVRGLEYLVARPGRRTEVADVQPHRFRHDTARRLVEATDLPTVAAWLGHERLDTVRIDSQPDEAALERAAAALEAH
jgi:integrase